MSKPAAFLPLALIVAVAENGVIGRAQGLPWHLSSDLKRFRALTWGKPMVMGRRTFQSIGRPLPGRTSIVIATDADFVAPDGVRVASDLDGALALAEAAARTMGADEIMVIGGRRVFAETLPLARILHLTQVHSAVEGDVHFPPYDRAQWREIAREGPLQGPGDDLAFSYVTLVRD